LVVSGNLEGDAPIFLADIDYARRLSKADILLWWSDMPRPDLGGRQLDANSQGLSDEPVNPQIVRSGAYTNACVEVAIRDLAIDAVMQSALVYELEGSEAGKSIGFSETSHNLDEYAKGTAHAAVILGDSILPTQIFSIVKAMVKTWWLEDSKGDGAHARRLMDHFWRWVTSPSSALYDPALQKFIHGLMRKTFSQLLAELRRLGSDIIYADFNRIMLATSKPSPGAAYAYGNYVVSSLTSRELFKFVNLRIIDFWSLFIQMDSSNFAGMICKDPLDDDDAQKPNSARTEMNWLIQALLPPAVQPQFEFLVGKFISGLRENKLKMSDSRTPLRILPNASQTQPDLQKKAEQDAAKAFMQTDMTRLILKAVDYLKKGYSDALVSDDEELRMAYQFPQFPGSTLTTQKVVLEFVKAVCAVLALAKELAPEVAVLRKNVLDLVGSREVRHPTYGLSLGMTKSLRSSLSRLPSNRLAHLSR
jgi:DNA polymerase epsilon subunit 1